MGARGRTLAAAAAGAAAMAAVLALGLVAVAKTGAYNVAATERHAPLTQWTVDTALVNSVRRRAQGLQPPARFTPAMIEAGAGEYKAMCAHCHGAPGSGRAGWAEGMLPLPPDLAEAAREWETREIFWIVRHGIKMTGMPAFGPTHDEATLWNIAGFVSRLPAMTPEQYTAFPEGHGAGEPEGEAPAPHGAPGHTH